MFSARTLGFLANNIVGLKKQHCLKSVFINNPVCQRTFSKITMSQVEGDKQKLSLVQDVDIDPQGRFKYILIKVYVDHGQETNDDEESEVFKYVVRGYASCEYHGDIYDRFCASISRIGGLDTECVGGGRILREDKKLTVFGYSQGYGRADHQKSVEILKKAYPDYDISWNNDGY